ncbi:Bacteriophage coat protein B [compost metagenome]
MAKKAKLAALAALSLAAGSAMATVPTEVTTALTEGKTDTLAVAGGALVIIIAVAVFKYMRRGV